MLIPLFEFEFARVVVNDGITRATVTKSKQGEKGMNANGENPKL